MAQPDRRALHVDMLLSSFSVAFANSQDAFIATKVFPGLPVQKQSDVYAVYDKNAFFRARARKREKGTESAGDGWEVDVSNSYNAARYDFHYDIHDDDRANADPIFNLEQDATQFVTHAMMITREKLWMDTYFKTAVWSTDWDGVANSTPGANEFERWDRNTSDPVGDVRTAADLIHQRTGYRPNTLVLSPQVLTTLEEHPDIRDRFKYTSSASITVDMLASAFRIGRVLIANATSDTADAGAAISMNFMAGKHALLVYSAPSPSPKQPSGGYTFEWKLPETGGTTSISISQFRQQHLNSDRVEGSMAFDMKLIAAEVGAFFENAIS